MLIMVCGAWEARTAVLFITVSASNILKLKENLYPITIFILKSALTCYLHAAGAPCLQSVPKNYHLLKDFGTLCSVVFPGPIILSRDNEW